MKKNQGFNNKVWVSGAIKPAETSTVAKSVNILLWLAAFAVIVAGVVVSEFVGSMDSSYVTSIGVVAVLLALVVARFTNQGRRFWAFLISSKLEMAKVVWPTRKETMTMTGMVIVVVMIFSLIIYLFGLLFGQFVQLFLG